jgi:hypothetical protein
MGSSCKIKPQTGKRKAEYSLKSQKMCVLHLSGKLNQVQAVFRQTGIQVNALTIAVYDPGFLLLTAVVPTFVGYCFIYPL